MSCSACYNSALRSCLTSSTEVAKTSGLRDRNVRHSTVEASRYLLQINSFTPRNQPGSISRISTLQAQARPTALSFIEGPRWTEPFHRDRNRSTIGVKNPTTTHGNPGGATQIMAASVALHSKRNSMKYERFHKSRPSPKKGTSVDQDFMKANMEGLQLRGDATSRCARDSLRAESSGSFKVAGRGGRAGLRDYSSRTVEGSKGAMLSTRSTKAFIDPRTGTQSNKDQREPWQTQKKALSEKFGPTGWLPRKRLSPDTLEGIRALHSHYPDKFTTPILADQFKVSPEAIRRILKSKWRPKDEEEERRRRRWEKRGESIWSQMVEMGIKPPKKWRDMGVGKSRERKPARSKQLQSRIKSNSITSSPRSQSTTNLHSITANEHKTGPPMLLADRIL